MAKRASSDIRGFFKQPKRDDQMVPEQHLDEEISDEERELQLSDDDCLQRYPAEETDGRKKFNIGGIAKFNVSLAKEYPFLKESKRGDNFCYCVHCNDDVKLGKDGKGKIVRHINNEKHKSNARANNNLQSLSSFVRTVNAKDVEKINASELSFAFYVAKHNNSFRSATCLSKLVAVVFADSLVAKGYSSCATKIAALIVRVIYPHLRERILEEINENGGYFSIGLDASPHNEHKLYALTLRYYTQSGPRNRLLVLVEMAKGKAVDMAKLIVDLLKEKGLDRNQLIAFTADNTSANFGGEFYTTVLEYINKWFHLAHLPSNMSWVMLSVPEVSYEEELVV